MKDSKLVEILQTLNPGEFKEFEKFVASSYFAVGRDLSPFLKILKSFYPDFENKNFTAEYIYSKLYSKKDNSGKAQQTIKTLSSELIRSCKDFFRQIEFEKDINHRNYYLNNQLRVRKLYKEFEKEYKISIDHQKESDNGGISDFLNRYYLSSVFRDYSLDKDDFDKAFESTLATNENLVAAALMVTFMFEDDKNISRGYNLPLRNTLMGNVLDNIDPEKLLETMKENNDRFYPYVLIFFMIYKMHRFRDKPEHFYELKDHLIKNKELFGQSENYVFWNILLSYDSHNNMGEDSKLFDHMLRNNIYKKSGNEDFHIILFRNIVTHYAALGEYDLLKNFIEKYSKEIHSEHRNNMYNYSYAHLHLAKKDFRIALEYIGKINYDIFVYKMDARVMLMEIYFELSYFEQAYSLIDSTLHFLRNTNEFSETHKSIYGNFVKRFKELLKLRSSDKREPHIIEQLEKIIANDKTAIQIKWFRNKMNEMKC